MQAATSMTEHGPHRLRGPALEILDFRIKTKGRTIVATISDDAAVVP